MKLIEFFKSEILFYKQFDDKTETLYFSIIDVIEKLIDSTMPRDY